MCDRGGSLPTFWCMVRCSAYLGAVEGLSGRRQGAARPLKNCLCRLYRARSYPAAGTARVNVNILFVPTTSPAAAASPETRPLNLAREGANWRRFQMLRRSVLSFTRRPLSTMASQTPMEDAMRAKVFVDSSPPQRTQLPTNHDPNRSPKPSDPPHSRSIMIRISTHITRPWQGQPPKKHISESSSRARLSRARCNRHGTEWSTPC